jgi:hypothetical protein
MRGIGEMIDGTKIGEMMAGEMAKGDEGTRTTRDGGMRTKRSHVGPNPLVSKRGPRR